METIGDLIKALFWTVVCIAVGIVAVLAFSVTIPIFILAFIGGLFVFFIKEYKE